MINLLQVNGFLKLSNDIIFTIQQGNPNRIELIKSYPYEPYLKYKVEQYFGDKESNFGWYKLSVDDFDKAVEFLVKEHGIQKDFKPEREDLNNLKKISDDKALITSYTAKHYCSYKRDDYSKIYEKFRHEIREMNLKATGFGSWGDFKKHETAQLIHQYCKSLVDKNERVTLKKIKEKFNLSQNMLNLYNNEHRFTKAYSKKNLKTK